MTKPKRKRLDTRAAGLRQAARTLDTFVREPIRWRGGVQDSGAILRALGIWAKEFRRLARAESRRGGE